MEPQTKTGLQNEINISVAPRKPEKPEQMSAIMASQKFNNTMRSALIGIAVGGAIGYGIGMARGKNKGKSSLIGAIIGGILSGIASNSMYGKGW